MSQPLTGEKLPPLEKTKPRKLKPHEQAIGLKKKRYEEPGCCDIVNCIVYWNGKCWVHLPDAGGPGPTPEIQVHYCPFCGEELHAGIPAKRRK